VFADWLLFLITWLSADRTILHLLWHQLLLDAGRFLARLIAFLTAAFA
jgi:hypothetical protein